MEHIAELRALPVPPERTVVLDRYIELEGVYALTIQEAFEELEKSFRSEPPNIEVPPDWRVAWANNICIYTGEWENGDVYFAIHTVIQKEVEEYQEKLAEYQLDLEAWLEERDRYNAELGAHCEERQKEYHLQLIAAMTLHRDKLTRHITALEEEGP